MLFKVISGRIYSIEEANCVYLVTDDWDDWFEFSTMYTLVYVDSDSDKHTIGSTKIGQFNMVKDQRRPNIPEIFEKLDENFFPLAKTTAFMRG